MMLKTMARPKRDERIRPAETEAVHELLDELRSRSRSARDLELVLVEPAATEVRVHRPRPRELLRGPRRDQTADAHDVRAVAHLERPVDVLLDEQDRQVLLLAQLRDELGRPSSTRIGARPSDGSSSSRSRGRAMSARAIASCCCSPPERVPAGQPVPLGEDREEVEQARLVLGDLSSGPSGRLRRSRGSRRSSAARRSRRPSGTRLTPRRTISSAEVPVTSRSSKQDAPALRLDEPGDRTERGRLAGAVRTEEGDDLALLDVQIQVADGDDLPVPGVKPFGSKHRRHRANVPAAAARERRRASD